MLRRIFHAAALAVVVLAASPAAGQAPAPAAATPSKPEPSARSLELVKRIMVATGVEDVVDRLIAAMLPTFANGKELQALPPESRDLVVNTMRETMRDTFTPKLVAAITPVYASAFTEEELAAVAAFYEGPVGRKLTTVTPELSKASSEAARALIPEFQAELLRRVCEKVDCHGELRKS